MTRGGTILPRSERLFRGGERKRAMKQARAGFAFILLLVSRPLLGQTPSLASEIDTTVVSVGDRITLRVTVNHPEGSRVIWPDSLNLEPFEVLGGQQAPTVSQGQSVQSSLALTLTAFELGDLEIPSFPVQVLSDVEETTVLHTSPFGVQVTSVGLDEGGDIRGLKGPMTIPVSLGRILLLGVAALLALVAAYSAFRRLKNRAGKGGETEIARPLPTLPPHEVALEAFRLLEASPLLSQGRIKDYHIQASEILRAYVEGQFGVNALEMTTADITQGLEGVGMEPDLVEETRKFLHGCDMVKFAKSRPSDAESLSTLKLGRKIVEDTAPASAPTMATAPAGTTVPVMAPATAPTKETGS